ncbi:thiamine ABC transporter permease [Leifsonia sp. Root227]|uniref:ECF transporter S component n=1 Tax=Leifsonia sp. Root227 TaxID=1736496 RepID=UPI0006F69C63|nr:ECF transporter S component [Leifsonia sp. Root227]KRC50532.1 thiamine ABC transporter permease [Leifsonia sp. Root227]
MSGDTAAPGTAAPGSATRWSLRDLMLVVVLGVVFGFLYWALVQGWITLSALAGPFGDLVQHVLLGGWLLVAPLAIAIVRRPFAGIVSEVIASVIEVVFLGSAVGPTLLIAAAIQGAGSELPFAAGRYRSYGWVRYMLSGALGAGAVFFYSAFRSGWYGTDLFWTRFVIQVLSGAIVGGLLAKVLVLAIARTGAVDNFAIGRDAAAAR